MFVNTYLMMDVDFFFKKNPKIKTVVNKVGNIETKFRTFEMELLAGEESFDTEVVSLDQLSSHLISCHLKLI